MTTQEIRALVRDALGGLIFAGVLVLFAVLFMALCVAL